MSTPQTKIRAAVTGVSHWVPEDRLTNADLEALVETSDEWIQSHVGIRERRILKEPGKATSYMGTQAVLRLLDQTGTDPAEIDLIVCATITPDMVYPAAACLIQDDVGAVNAWGFDLSAACSGFVYALLVGAQFIESGAHRKVVVVGADKMSSAVDYTDRNTCILFGDGAGAALLEPSPDGEHGIHDFMFHVDGAGRDCLKQPGGGSLHPASHETVEKRMHFVYQEGPAVFKFASSRMAEASVNIMKRNGLTSDDIALLVPHQANKRIITACARRMKLPMERVLVNIDEFGNTTAATVVIALSQAAEEKRMQKGDWVVLAAAGGGFTWGSALLKWAY